MLRKPLNIFLVVLFSYLVAALTSNLIVDHKSKLVLSIEIETNHAGVWQLFWSNNEAFKQDNSIRRFVKGSGVHTIIYPLADKKVRYLRLDPTDGSKNKKDEFFLRSIKLSNGFGTIYEKIDAEDITPLNPAIAKIDHNTFVITGLDPQLKLDISSLIIKSNKDKHTVALWLLRVVFFVGGNLLILLCIRIFNIRGWGNELSIVFYRSVQLWPFLFLGGMIASIYGFINGFPLVFSDTGMYLKSGVEWFVPTDRPIMYGIYLLASSLRYYLWVPIILQGMIITYCCYLLLENTMINRSNAKKLTLLLVLILSLFTSLSWFSSQLTPDIFCAIAPLALLILYLDSSKFVSRYIALTVIFLVCNLSHTTSMLICLALSAFIFIVSVLFRKYFSFQKAVFLCVLSVVSFPLLMTLNYSISGKFTTGEGSYIFMSAKLADLGLLQKYLKENPKGRDYQIAEMVDDIKQKSNHFIWSNESVIHKMPRKVLKSELKEINRDILSDPSDFSYLIWKGAQQSFKLFVQGSRKYGFHSYKGKYVHDIIKKYFPEFERSFLDAMQQRWALNDRLNLVANSIVLWTSYIGIPILLIIFRKKIPLRFLFSCISIFFVLVVNDFVCATLSTGAERYHARISWIVVVALFLLVVKLFESVSLRNTHMN